MKFSDLSSKNISRRICSIMTFLRLLVFLCVIFIINAQHEQCYSDTFSPYVYFSSKTSYFASRGSKMNIPQNCTPIYSWSLIRHGTRYPSHRFFKTVDTLYRLKDEIIQNHKEGRGKLCKKDLENLEKWTTNVTANLQGKLTSQGSKDLEFFARKFKETFPELMSSSKDSFKFRNSEFSRTKDSALSFTNELLGTNFTNTDGNNIIKNEALLHRNQIIVLLSTVGCTSLPQSRSPLNPKRYNVSLLPPNFNGYLKKVLIERGGLKYKYPFRLKHKMLSIPDFSSFLNIFIEKNFTKMFPSLPAAEKKLAVKHCPQYWNEIENNPTTDKEIIFFRTTNFMQKIISDISTRLGFKESLPYDSLEVIYDICGFETAWYLNSKPAFCAVFLPDQLKVFEYLDDMYSYYRYGYVNSYGEKLGCPLVRDMMISLSNAAKTPNYKHKATFYFSHSEMMIPLNVKLGLNRDEEPLKYDNYEYMKDKRKWKLANFDSFAANLVVVLYKCQDANGIQDKVVFYQNEREVKPPKCVHNPCTLEDLQFSFQDVFDERQCNLQFCGESESVTKSNGSALDLSLSLIIFSYFLHTMQLRK